MEELVKELFQKKTEDQHLDYKESFNWDAATNPIRGEIIKDVISFFNVSDGGKILIGVQNEAFEPIGMKKEDFDSFDTTKVNQFLEKYTDPTHFCKVHKVIIDGKYFVLIDCPEFSDVPILTIKDLHGENNKRVLIANALYYRNEKGESTVISSSQDFRDLISRSLRKKKQTLLSDIEAILTGHQPRKEIKTEFFLKPSSIFSKNPPKSIEKGSSSFQKN